MLRTLTVSLTATWLLATLIIHLSPERHARAFAIVGDLSPTIDLRAEFNGHPSRFERCGLATHASEEELRAVQVVIDVRSQQGARVTYAGPTTLLGADALLRCIQAEVSRVLRSYRGSPLPLTIGAFTVDAFATLDLPMEPAPLAATQLLTSAELDVRLAQLRGAPDDAGRLAQLAELEAARAALPATAARAVLATFAQPDALVAGRLCRLLTGRGALRAVQAAVASRERARLRGLTRGQCGVDVVTPPAQPVPSPVEGPGQVVNPNPQPGGPQAAECMQDSDCVLACPVPPACCPATCGCSHSVPRSEAAGIRAACEGVRNRQCPAMGCARQEFHAICRAGQCRSERGAMGMY